MITKNELRMNAKVNEREIKLERAFSLMLQKYLPTQGVISLRWGLGSQEICEDGELCYPREREHSMQFQRHELEHLMNLAKKNGFSVRYEVNSHNVGFYLIS